MDGLRVTSIDRADNKKKFRRWGSFWQYKLNIFFSRRLNERNVPTENEQTL